ncbi:hypothetical protein Taro_001409 [Colocasia esculenta]|uniref:Uncharacterized protein n=1 Tax=Colocasia esculenta TaxID=4460 RepID=A0A843TFW6_COLES|nr:hypothetical protein [Colocasia esculenta]
MENFLDKSPNPSLQVVYENSNLQTGNTAVIKRHRNLIHSSEAKSEGLQLITYSRRSSKARHMQKKENQNTSLENLQKNVSHNKNSSIVKPAETGFWRKKNNDATFGEMSLGVDGKDDGPMREGRQGDQASTVSTDCDPNKAIFLDTETNKCTRWSWWRKTRNKPSSNARQVSVSEKVVSVSKESENIDSVKNADLHPELLSKSVIKMVNNNNQRMSEKQNNSGVQIDSTIIAVNKSDLHCSPRHRLKIRAVNGSLSSTSGTGTSISSSNEVHLLSRSSFPESGELETMLGLAGSAEKFSQRIVPSTFVDFPDHDKDLGTAGVALIARRDRPAPGVSNNAVPPFVLELPACTVSLVGISVVDPPATSRAEEKIVPQLSKFAPAGVAPWALPEWHGNPSHIAATTEPLISGLMAEASRVESPAIETSAQIVEKSPFEVAPRVESPSGALANGASKASQSFPALGIEWPDGPQVGVALGSREVAAQLVQSLDMLLKVDSLPTVEVMRSKLEECTRGYHAFGLPRDTWMAKLTSLWDEFTRLHAIQEQRQRTQMMIQREEEQLCRLQATQAEVYAQVKIARRRSRRASLRVKKLQREVLALLEQAQEAKEECNSAQAEAETLQYRLDGLQGEVLLSKIHIANLRRNGP